MKKFFIVLVLAVAASSCAVKDDTLPIVDPNNNSYFYGLTAERFSATGNSITLNYRDFQIVSGATVTAYGFCCSNTGTPTLSNYSCYYSYPVSDGVPFVIEGLTPNTAYFCRAFFIISNGTAYYSDVVTVTTTSPLVIALDGYPTSNTKDGGFVSAVATIGSFEGCTERGFCYGTSETPTVSDGKVTVPGTSSPMSGYIPMSPGQVYYYRAYARMTDGSYIYSDDSYYIQTYAVTEDYSASSVKSGTFYNDDGESYSYSVSLDTHYSYYSTSQLTEIGFKTGPSSWYWTYVSDGARTDSRTWLFQSYTITLNYQAYAVLKDGKRVWGEEKTAYFY